jgi:diguanylate cyclase (GGDEF)-like protein/PAS domain S-box-containing protein
VKLFRNAGSSLGPNPLLRLALSQILLYLLVGGLMVFTLYQSRHQYEQGAQIDSQNLAQFVQHDISASVHAIDLALLDLASEYKRQEKEGGISTPALNAFIEERRQRTPGLDGIRLADQNGWITHGTGVTPAAQISIADRNYFERLRSEADLTLLITKPLMGRLSKKTVIFLARAVRHVDGSFAGVIAAELPLSYFTEKLSVLTIGANGSFVLFDDDFELVARVPERPGDEALWGQKIRAPQILKFIQQGKLEGAYANRSAFDQLDRMGVYRKIPNTPFNVSIGLAEIDYLAPWHDEVCKTGILFAVFMLVTLLMSGFIYRAWHQQAVAVQALKDANQTLATEKQLNQAIIAGSPTAIFTRDPLGRVTSWNPAAEQFYGWSAAEAMGKPLQNLPSGKQAESDELRRRVMGGEYILDMELQRQHRDGRTVQISTTLTPLEDAQGQITGYLAMATDITQRKAAEKQVEFLAYHDALTGLPNRLLLQDRFAQAMAQADRTHTRVALLFLDLDNFKTINDSLGHVVGDAFLKEVAQRLCDGLRESDTVCRQGGDEFLMVLGSLDSANACTPVLNALLARVAAPFLVDGHELVSSASIGVAVYPDDGQDFEALLQKADTAMYQAKEAGRNNYRYFDEQMNVRAADHLFFKNGLRKAIERGELVLHYQPQIELTTGQVTGVEALIRWNHPERGLLLPGRFIALAEETGLIVPLGEWVIQEALRQGVAWRQAGLPALMMAVNLSPVQFKRGDVVQVVTQALHTTGFDPHCLELEMTESVLLHDTDKVLADVRRLKLLGVKLSIDDFGTGYSSLSYLKRFDVDKLKIDQSFVRDLVSDPDDAAIVRAIIQMAHSLGLKTVAEGVENAVTQDLLRRFECDGVQGYHVARAMDATALDNYLRAFVPTPAPRPL